MTPMSRKAALLLAALVLGAPAALPVLAPAAHAQADSREARDRRAILGMTGDFEVTFDFRETTVLSAGYKPIPGKAVGGEEVVRAIEDRPGKVVLQHMIVAVVDSKPLVIKHWRQDWTYEPKSVLVYTAMGRWSLKPVPEAERKGAWSQTVWETDDSPRYGAVGHWTYDDGVTQWVGSETRRPLARRDATRHPVYDHYIGTNRHILTPKGWVQQEDNEKIGSKDGKPTAFVRETVTNTYDRFTGFPVAAADAYWARTQGYWAQVRAAWDQAITHDNGVTVPEDVELGSVTGERLMDLADEVNDGKTATADAAGKAQCLIAKTAAMAVASR
jgi:hypothetical protein